MKCEPKMASKHTSTAEQGNQSRAYPRICLLGADYENSNLGIRALTTGALTAIDALLPNALVHIVDYGVAPREFVFDLPNRTLRVPLLNIRFSKKPWMKNHIARLILTAWLLSLVPSTSLRKRLSIRNPWLQVILQADRVLSLSYGDSFSDIYGLQRFIYVSLPQLLAILLRRPLVHLPQTMGPFKSRFCGMMAKWVLSRSDTIYLRDKRAVPEIQALLPEQKRDRVLFCHDLGFIVPPQEYVCVDPPLQRVFSRRPVVGLNVSGLLWMGGYTRDNMFGLKVDYQLLIKKTITEFIERKHATVLLVPHLLWSRGEGDPPVCDEILRDFNQVYPGRIFTVRPPFGEREIKSVIAKCDFFVGARMHACIAALSQTVPTVAMAYSGKFIGVLRSVGVESDVADLRISSVDEILTLLSSCFDMRDSTRAVLKQTIPLAHQSMYSVMRGLAEMADSRPVEAVGGDVKASNEEPT
jgi:polysaccharide pyruvyl transferase WcaK-like protein